MAKTTTICLDLPTDHAREICLRMADALDERAVIANRLANEFGKAVSGVTAEYRYRNQFRALLDAADRLRNFAYAPTSGCPPQEIRS